MTRFFAAILFCVWTVCYAHCAAAALGGGETAVDTCCQHEQPVGGESPAEEAPCGICDAILSGGLLLVKEVFTALVLLLTGLMLAVIHPVLLRAWRVIWRASAAIWRRRSADPPWRAPRLGEFLARTACPVRGPDVAAA